MIKYYFIPKTLENNLFSIINSWENNNPNKQIIVNGVYNKSDILNNSDSSIYNKSVNGNIDYIKYGYNDVIDNINYELIGFVIESDLNLTGPEYYPIIEEHSEILQFNTAEEFLNWKQI